MVHRRLTHKGFLVKASQVINKQNPKRTNENFRGHKHLCLYTLAKSCNELSLQIFSTFCTENHSTTMMMKYTDNIQKNVVTTTRNMDLAFIRMKQQI